MFKVNVGGADLKKLVAALMPVVSRSSIPVLNMGWFRIDDGRLVATTTNQDQSMTGNCKCDGDGAALIHMAKLSAFLGVIPNCGIVSLSENEGIITATCGDVRYSVPTLPVDAFPQSVAEEIEGGKEWKISGAFLAEAFSILFPACERGDIMRRYMHGAWFQEGRLIATDSYLLGSVPCPELVGVGEIGFLFPSDSIVLCKSILGTPITVTLSKDGSAASLTNDDGFSFRTKLIDGIDSAPAFDRVTPTPNVWIASDANYLKAALLQGALSVTVGKPTETRVSVSVREGKIEFRSAHDGSASLGTSDCDFEGKKIKGSDIEFAASYAYLAWAIDSLNADVVQVGYTDNTSPILFRASAGDEKNFRLVTTMR